VTDAGRPPKQAVARAGASAGHSRTPPEIDTGATVYRSPIETGVDDDQRRREAADELIALTEEMGLY
jgi:hypothetical protein